MLNTRCSSADHASRRLRTRAAGGWPHNWGMRAPNSRCESMPTRFVRRRKTSRLPISMGLDGPKRPNWKKMKTAKRLTPRKDWHAGRDSPLACARYRIHGCQARLGAGQCPRFGGYDGTPGGIREPAKLAMSSRPLADRNPRPSGSKNHPTMRNNAGLRSVPCRRLHRAAKTCTGDGPTAVYGPSIYPKTTPHPLGFGGCDLRPIIPSRTRRDGRGAG